MYLKCLIKIRPTKHTVAKNPTNAKISGDVMGNTVPKQPEPKLVKFEPKLQPNILCKMCGCEFQKGDTIYYQRRQYWHICCRKQESGEDSREKYD